MPIVGAAPRAGFVGPFSFNARWTSMTLLGSLWNVGTDCASGGGAAEAAERSSRWLAHNNVTSRVLLEQEDTARNRGKTRGALARRPEPRGRRLRRLRAAARHGGLLARASWNFLNISW